MVSRIGGMTRSERCYKPDALKASQEPIMDKRKEKEYQLGDLEEVWNEDPTIFKGSFPKKVVSDEEAFEFLKLSKHSEYKVIEQLHLTLARISILLLFLNSEPQGKALLDVLNKAHVNHDITVGKTRWNYGKYYFF